MTYLPLPQLASSELSPQSFSPSQMNGGRAQRPVPHWKRPGWHLNSAVWKGRKDIIQWLLDRTQDYVQKSSELHHPNMELQLKRKWLRHIAKPPLGVILLWSTHGSQQVRPNRPHNHPPCHTSTRKGCTHQFHSETVSIAGQHRKKHKIWPQCGHLIRFPSKSIRH